MRRVRVRAALTFPLRVNPTGYRVEHQGTTWTLIFERVQRQVPDERIAGPGTTNVDLEVDRAGQLAYSRVSADTVLSDEVGSADSVVPLFLGAINFFIAQVRDVLNVYWIRQLREDDLFQLKIEIDDQGTAFFTAGPGGGSTNAVVGLSDEANNRLIAAIQSEKSPPVWRQMYLDAQDALSVGRLEDSIVLAWSALEAACRQNLPGMAYRAHLTVVSLAEKLDVRDRKKRPPLSYEEAVSRVSGGIRIVEVAAELTEPRIYHTESVSGSVDLAYRLRNRIAHQGVRVWYRQAKRAVESIGFVLHTALSLRNVVPPPATISWQNHFRSVNPEVSKFASENGVRLVLAHPDRLSPAMELMGDELWLRLPSDMNESTSCGWMLVQWDAWQRCSLADRPRFVDGPPSGILLEGLVEFEVSGLNDAVCFAEALIAASSAGELIVNLAEYGAARTTAALVNEAALNPNDARLVVIAGRLAAYLAALPKERWDSIIEPLAETQSEIHRLAQKWAEPMSSIDPNEKHSRCSVLRTIHADGMWLDTIQILCPVEGVIYGSSVNTLK